MHARTTCCLCTVWILIPPSSWWSILSSRHLHPLKPTFELRQRRKLNWGALCAVLGRALGFSLLLGLPHGLSGKPVHFLRCRDGRHFDAQSAEDFRWASVSPRIDSRFNTKTRSQLRVSELGSRLSPLLLWIFRHGHTMLVSKRWIVTGMFVPTGTSNIFKTNQPTAHGVASGIEWGCLRAVKRHHSASRWLCWTCCKVNERHALDKSISSVG